jgi:hypothetical protein
MVAGLMNSDLIGKIESRDTAPESGFGQNLSLRRPNSEEGARLFRDFQ